MSDSEIINKSVTKQDYPEDPRGGVVYFMVPYWGLPGGGQLPPAPPDYWTKSRDWVLRSTVLQEDMWGSAIAIAATKMAALNWEVDSEVPLRAKRAQELLLEMDWTTFIYQHLRDYLTTDNGSFIEIVRASRAIGSRIIGLVHLDSMRCQRTGDPDIPILYTDRKGKEHELKDYQVICLSDMPDPGATYFGVGLSAASRAYKAIYKLASIERYVTEKVSGRRPLAIHFVNSISRQQLANIRNTADAAADQQGVLSYMGAIVVPLMDADKPPEVATVDLAGLPDGFNRKEEFDIALLTYANAIGLDPQELQPLTGQPLGTSNQSQILEDKGKGKGLSAWRQMFTHALNQEVLGDETTFIFIEKDYRDMLRASQVSKGRADTIAVMIDKQIISPEQGKQLLIDMDELPKEFAEEEAGTSEKLSDQEKPEDEQAEQEPAPKQETEAEPEPEEETETQAEKEARDARKVMEAQIKKAIELYRQAAEPESSENEENIK